MLRGETIILRQIRESDLDAFYSRLVDVANHGDYFPHTMQSWPAFRKEFDDGDFWSKDAGILLIVSPDDALLGHIEFFKTVNYLDEYELSYEIYRPEDRGKGAATEAVRMLVRYLFETKRMNRIRLVIHPDNAASRRLAEKCGFQDEGRARGAWYAKGRHHDVQIYSILHDDVITG